MCADTADLTYEGMLTDPLIRLVMDSDGVSLAQLAAVLREAAAARAEFLPMPPPLPRLTLIHSQPLPAPPLPAPAVAPMAERVRPTGT